VVEEKLGDRTWRPGSSRGCFLGKVERRNAARACHWTKSGVNLGLQQSSLVRVVGQHVGRQHGGREKTREEGAHATLIGAR